MMGHCMRSKDSAQSKSLLVYDQASARELFDDCALLEDLGPNDMVYVCDTCVRQSDFASNPSDKECALCCETKPVEQMIDNIDSPNNVLFTFLRDACEKKDIDKASIPLFNVKAPCLICREVDEWKTPRHACAWMED